MKQHTDLSFKGEITTAALKSTFVESQFNSSKS